MAEKEDATSQIVPESRRLEPRNTLSWKLHGCNFAFGPVAVDISRTCLFCLFAWQEYQLFNYELLSIGAAGHCNETRAPNGKLHGPSLYLIAFLDATLAGWSEKVSMVWVM